MTEAIIDAYIDRYDAEDALLLLKALGHPSQGGLGYRIETFNPAIDMDGYDVDTEAKVIRLDTAGIFSNNSAQDMAAALKDALDIDVFERRHSLLYRVGWGTGKTVLGVIETAVGVVGILIPEPGTTAAGVVMVGLGVNGIADGVSQIFGANGGEGYNVLGEGSAWVGANVADLVGADLQTGATIGRLGFTVASVAVGSFGSFRILHAPGRSMLRMTGPSGGSGFGVGRLDAWYGVAVSEARAGNGALTVISVTNNSNQSILRVVLQAVDGNAARLYVNGRIVGVAGGNLLKHEGNWRVIAKGLAKLLYHGARSGW